MTLGGGRSEFATCRRQDKIASPWQPTRSEHGNFMSRILNALGCRHVKHFCNNIVKAPLRLSASVSKHNTALTRETSLVRANRIVCDPAAKTFLPVRIHFICIYNFLIQTWSRNKNWMPRGSVALSHSRCSYLS